MQLQQPRSTLRSIDQWERSTGSVSPVLPRACVLTTAINIEILQCYDPNRFSIIIIFFEFTSSPLSLACVRRPRDSHNNNNIQSINVIYSWRCASERACCACVRVYVPFCSLLLLLLLLLPVRSLLTSVYVFFHLFRLSSVDSFLVRWSSSSYFCSSCRSISSTPTIVLL